jgi:hypothetical protein
MRLPLRSRTILTLSAAGLIVVGCIISSTTRPASIPPGGPQRDVRTPIKAHMIDGSVVLFPAGATISPNSVYGTGQRYDATRTGVQQVSTVPMDSVLGFETYERQINPGRTLLYGTGSFALSVVAIAGLSVAIFGSCPTIYADSAGTQVLQAESFSNSIAPLLARRDLDRLIAVADANGIVRLDVRNEAMETHYIDHLELIEFRHRANEMALPAARGGVIAVSHIVAPQSVRDGAGRDVSSIVAADDDLVFSTDSGYLSRAIDGGPVEDHIDVTVPRSAVGDTLALVLRVRASLLSTTVLYDYMLGRPGASSLDWLGQDLAKITALAKLANWYSDNFGLHVSVRDGDKWKPVARMLNFGPAAWRSIAVVVPTLGTDSVRMRLSFLADEYRIDRIGIASGARKLDQRRIPIARLLDANNAPRPDVRDALRKADARDISTQPGERFFAEFDVGQAAPGTRTFMVGSEGYYTEWVRASWIRQAKDSVPFNPSRVSPRDVLRTWRSAKDTLEQRFFVRRVPVV